MELINFELNNVKKIISENIDEILPNDGIKSFVLGKSKYIRTILPVLYIQALGLKPTINIYKCLAVGELIHNASLLHDDVIDSASERRGDSTINEKYSPKISVLCGDYLISKATNVLMSIDNSLLFDKFNTCIQKMVKAEVLQYFNRGKKPSVDVYLSICNGKTAELFATIMYSCSILLSLNDDNFENLGRIFGLNFQINNDLDTRSIVEDKKNMQSSIIDVMGIENTYALLDNNKKKMREIVSNLPDNVYKHKLEDLIS